MVVVQKVLQLVGVLVVGTAIALGVNLLTGSLALSEAVAVLVGAVGSYHTLKDLFPNA